MANTLNNDTTITDDTELLFGTSGDFKVKYDSAATRLEVLDAADNVLVHVTDNGSTATVDIAGDISASDITADADLTVGGFFNIGSHVEYTISSGEVTVASSNCKIDTEGDAASDDLDTINGGETGDMMVLSPQSDSRTVVVKHGTGNIETISGGDVTLDEVHKLMWLVRNGAKWVQLGGR